MAEAGSAACCWAAPPTDSFASDSPCCLSGQTSSSWRLGRRSLASSEAEAARYLRPKLRRWLEQTPVQRITDQLGAVVEVQLLHDALAIRIDGLAGQVEPAGDLLV